ncbi:MAG: hypothetical protein WDZ52_01305 [Pseudohongiellaceae bacterium]
MAIATVSFARLPFNRGKAVVGEFTLPAEIGHKESYGMLKSYDLKEQEVIFIATPEWVAGTRGPSAANLAATLSTFTLNNEGGIPVSPDSYLGSIIGVGENTLAANTVDYPCVVPDILLVPAQIRLRESCR